MNLGANWIMGERNPLLKYLQAAGLQVTELDLFETDEVKIIHIIDGEFIDITDEAEEYFVKDGIKTAYEYLQEFPARVYDAGKSMRKQ